jgi:hypothetical protein
MIVGISGKIGSGKDTVAAMIQDLTRKEIPEYMQRDGDNWVPSKGGSPFVIRRFAGALKEIVALLTGCDVRDFESQEFKNRTLPEMWNRTLDDAKEWLLLKDYHPGSLTDEGIRHWATEKGFKFERTYREMLQEIGTNVMRRHFLDNVWINALFSTYLPEPQLHDPYEEHKHMELPKWLVPDVRFPNEAKAIHERGGILVRVNRYPKEDTFQYTTGPNIPAQHSSETALDNYKGFDVVIDNTGTLEDLYNKVTDLVTQFKLQTYHERKGATASRTTTTDASAGTGT